MREMKDSGVEWIGEIPKDWELTKISSVYQERNIKVSDKDFIPLSVTKQGVVPQLESAAKTDNGDNRKLIKKGDFVINSRSDRRGSCGISEYDGSCSLINTVLQPRKDISNSYYGFVFYSECFADEFYRWGNGIVDDLWSTKWTNMKRIYIPVPSLKEQYYIADYLNEKCTKIDAIVTKQQKIIEKLKEYKLSVISEMVMDSACPIISLGRCIDKIEQGWSPNPSEKNQENDWSVLSLAAVKDGKFNKSETKSFIGNKDRCEYLKLNKGDFLLTRSNTREYVGAACIVDDVSDNTIFSDLIYRISFKKHFLLPSYTLYFFQSAYARQQIERDAHGSSSTMVKITHKDIANWKIPLPSIERQKAISERLHSLDGYLRNEIEKRSIIIGKLIAYKKSLIYEVVTGKKEV